MSLTFDFPRVSQFVAAAVGCNVSVSGAAAIGWQRDDELLAGVLYEQFTGEGGSITAHIAVAPASVMTKEFTRAIFGYPFNQLKVAKVFAMVADDNPKSVRLVEHMGFEQETVVGGYFPGGNMIVFSMTADKCKWLEV